MHQFLRIDKQDECRGLHSHLGRVHDLEHVTLVARRLLHHAGFTYDLIEYARLNAHILVRAHKVDLIVQFDQSLACLRGDEDDLRIREKRQHGPDLVSILLYGVVVLLHKIPFVDCYNNGFASVVGDAGNLRVLLRDALLGVDHEDRYVRSLDRAYRADDHIALKVLLDLILAAKSRRIDKDVFLAVVPDPGVNGVPGRPRDVGDNNSVLADQTVYDRRLAYVGFTDDCHVDRVVLFLLAGPCPEVFHHFIEHIADSGAVGG